VISWFQAFAFFLVNLHRASYVSECCARCRNNALCQGWSFCDPAAAAAAAAANNADNTTASTPDWLVVCGYDQGVAPLNPRLCRLRSDMQDGDVEESVNEANRRFIGARGVVGISNSSAGWLSGAMHSEGEGIEHYFPDVAAAGNATADDGFGGENEEADEEEDARPTEDGAPGPCESPPRPGGARPPEGSRPPAQAPPAKNKVGL
jgi:hypothetical protein